MIEKTGTDRDLEDGVEEEERGEVVEEEAGVDREEGVEREGEEEEEGERRDQERADGSRLLFRSFPVRFCFFPTLRMLHFTLRTTSIHGRRVAFEIWDRREQFGQTIRPSRAVRPLIQKFRCVYVNDRITEPNVNVLQIEREYETS